MRSLVALAALLAIFVVGCAPKEEATSEPTNSPSVTNPTEDQDTGAKDDDSTEDADEPGDDDTKTSQEGVDMELAVYKNSAGKLACPVMDVEIESEKAAYSHTDHNGKRYYFCCNGCPQVFDKNKDKYAK